MARAAQILVIGLGNPSCGDDAVGPWIANELIGRIDAQVLVASGEGTALMEAWSGFETVILIDAVHSGGEPGTIFRLNAHQGTIPGQFFHYSTHAFSLAEAIELARALDELPPRLLIYGIEGGDFTTGVSFSPAVAAAAVQVAAQIRQEVQDLLKETKLCTSFP